MITKKFELKEVCRYDGTRYYLYIDGTCVKAFNSYDDAYVEFTLAVNFIEKTTVLVSKEIEL